MTRNLRALNLVPPRRDYFAIAILTFYEVVTIQVNKISNHLLTKSLPPVIIIVDGFVKSQNLPFFWIPAKPVLDPIGERASSIKIDFLLDRHC